MVVIGSRSHRHRSKLSWRQQQLSRACGSMPPRSTVRGARACRAGSFARVAWLAASRWRACVAGGTPLVSICTKISVVLPRCPRRALSRATRATSDNPGSPGLRVATTHVDSTTSPALEDHEPFGHAVLSEFAQALAVAPFHRVREFILGLAAPIAPQVSHEKCTVEGSSLDLNLLDREPVPLMIYQRRQTATAHRPARGTHSTGGRCRGELLDKLRERARLGHRNTLGHSRVWRAIEILGLHRDEIWMLDRGVVGRERSVDPVLPICPHLVGDPWYRAGPRLRRYRLRRL